MPTTATPAGGDHRPHVFGRGRRRGGPTWDAPRGPYEGVDGDGVPVVGARAHQRRSRLKMDRSGTPGRRGPPGDCGRSWRRDGRRSGAQRLAEKVRVRDLTWGLGQTDRSALPPARRLRAAPRRSGHRWLGRRPGHARTAARWPRGATRRCPWPTSAGRACPTSYATFHWQKFDRGPVAGRRGPRWDVSGRSVGYSRGTEAALLAAEHFPNPNPAASRATGAQRPGYSSPTAARPGPGLCVAPGRDPGRSRRGPLLAIGDR